ncbi:hypothetical protein [Defluviimonas sp. SAOS-178_SWC]|uniref:hypothetical protein n=1 Tax=Defluviimonas sp. SAOS-178_SWC TaxID=3121287 RepID=UPI00322140DC
MAENLATDLFGDLVTLPSGRRGRPAHCWTKSNADKVILGLAMGYSDPEIASGMGISLPTLKKYYFSELKRRDMQRTRFELWRAKVLADEANAGNVGALKELGKVVEKRDRHLAEQRLRSEPSQRDEPVGKKEAARRAAAEQADADPDLTPGLWH